MKNAIRFIATGLVISLASASFAQTNSNSKTITAPSEVTSKTLVSAPADVVNDKGRTDFQNFRNQHPAIAKVLFSHRQEMKDNGISKKEARKMLHKRMVERRDNASGVGQFQDNHPRLANAIMDHRAAFARKGITGREAMHRVAAHRARVR